MKTIKILALGDVVGKPGRQILKEKLKSIQEELEINFTIVNIENAAGGQGITTKTYLELANLDIQAFTSGNHVYNQKESLNDFDLFKKLTRPLNYPDSNPGQGYRIFNYNEHKIAVVNLLGRVFMGLADCPFKTMESHLAKIKEQTPNIIIDFHAETTSEKQALGWFLDGKVSAIFGTHTHVITADERFLPQETAYITDIGMVGAMNTVIGMQKEPVLNRFITHIPSRFEPPKSGVKFINGIVMELDPLTGKMQSINRVQKTFG